MENVIDISKWQSTYNAATAKAAGIDEVILRCAYGTSKDVKFDEFYDAAKAAGQTIGAYGFATWHYSSKNGGSIDAARSVMQEQIAAWVSICAGKLDGWFAIDQELESGYTMGLSGGDNEILLNEATALLADAGFAVCIYCSASWAMTQFNKDNVGTPLWIAYYYADPTDPDFGQEANYETASGVYFDYMRSLGEQLAGWQFGRIGYGSKYGVGSDNLDKNVFYRSAQPSTSYEPFSQEAVRLICGYASAGDVATIEDAFAALQIGTTSADGFVVSDIAVSRGDQVSIIALCADLIVPCAVYTEPEVEDVPEVEEVLPEVEPEAEDEVLPEVEPEAEDVPEADSDILPETDGEPLPEEMPEMDGDIVPETEEAPEIEEMPEGDDDILPEVDDTTAAQPEADADTTPDLAVDAQENLVNTLLAIIAKLLGWIYDLLKKA